MCFYSIKSKLCCQWFVYKSDLSTVCDHQLVIRITCVTMWPVTLCCFFVVSACGLEDCETLFLRLRWTSLLSKHATGHPEQLPKLTSGQSLHSQTGQQPQRCTPALYWLHYQEILSVQFPVWSILAHILPLLYKWYTANGNRNFRTVCATVKKLCSWMQKLLIRIFFFN